MGPIKGMVTSEGPLLDLSELIDLTILGSLWVHEALGAMLTSIVSNSRFGKRPGAWDITIFSLPFFPHVTSSVFCYWWNFRISGRRPSLGLLFCVLSMTFHLFGGPFDALPACSKCRTARASTCGPWISPWIIQKSESWKLFNFCCSLAYPVLRTHLSMWV